MNDNCQEIGIDAVLIEQLLALPTQTQQLAFLRESDLWYETTWFCLLDEAANLVRSNPGQARRLALLCTAVAGQPGLADIAPRAAYIQAQTHALAGEFDQALELIRAARTGYEALGQPVPALRTTAGLMHVLGESGRYQEALAAGQQALAEIKAMDQPELTPLAALIQQNMGMCYSLTGRYAEALAVYDAAENTYLSQGMTAQASDISNNRGVLLWEMGRGSEALAALENALDIRTAAGLTMLQAQSLGNIGSAQLLLGRYSQSLAAFEQARRLFTSLDVLVDQHVLLLDTATAYLTLNLYPEAQAAFEEAAQLLEAAGAVHQRTRALWGLGATLLAQKQLDEAEQVLAEAVALLQATSDAPTPLLATILLEQAAVQAARGQRDTAVSTASHALTLVTGQDWLVPAIYAHLQLADLTQDNLAQAETHLLAAHHLARPLNLPPLRYRLQQRHGRLCRLQGRHEEARTLLEAAITEIERLRGTLAQETMRTSFLHDKVAAYNDLMQLYLAEADMARAFTVAEQAKSRALLDLISGVITADTPGQAETPEAAQLQALQADLNAIYNEMLDGGQSRPADQQQTIQSRAAELENAISQLRLRLAAIGDAAEWWATPLPLETVQGHLPEDTTLLAYHIIEDEIIAFVIKQQSIQVVRSVGQASAVQALWRRLSGLLDRLRAAGMFSRDNMVALELSARRVLAALYQALVAPLAQELDTAVTHHTAPKLTIIPHGCLHQIPFQALFDGQNYLIDRFEIAYAPSAAIAWHCQQRPAMAAATAAHKALVVGVSDPSIPAVTAEIESVAAHLPQAQTLVDEQATLAALRAAAADCDMLHLACHGLFRADNPMFSALKLHDGWLTAGDAMHLRLRQALVTLSACETGRSQVMGGDEMLGLLRAFLGSGAATVVVTLWLAQDETTARLMADWYARLRAEGVSPVTALRESQLALKAEYPHPYFWAPFVAVGRR
ncbi:MAG: CHAT domain-containing protein [Anaerolineae bacterium]|nr:CHAT domain-containing protein [Anaerolineae bacterium]